VFDVSKELSETAELCELTLRPSDDGKLTAGGVQLSGCAATVRGSPPSRTTSYHDRPQLLGSTSSRPPHRRRNDDDGRGWNVPLLLSGSSSTRGSVSGLHMERRCGFSTKQARLETGDVIMSRADTGTGPPPATVTPSFTDDDHTDVVAETTVDDLFPTDGSPSSSASFFVELPSLSSSRNSSNSTAPAVDVARFAAATPLLGEELTIS